jgi:hypothetical protein
MYSALDSPIFSLYQHLYYYRFTNASSRPHQAVNIVVFSSAVHLPNQTSKVGQLRSGCGLLEDGDGVQRSRREAHGCIIVYHMPYSPRTDSEVSYMREVNASPHSISRERLLTIVPPSERSELETTCLLYKYDPQTRVWRQACRTCSNVALTSMTSSLTIAKSASITGAPETWSIARIARVVFSSGHHHHRHSWVNNLLLFENTLSTWNSISTP